MTYYFYPVQLYWSGLLP